jgi:ADP-ribose pyrophosphatase YjhB (NUDIX family)
MMGKPYRYCPVCGTRLEQRHVDPENRVRDACPACDFIHYENPTPAAGVILIEDASVLLVERKFEPRAGMWTLPAGFIEAGEGVAECAIREAKEETNLDLEVIRLFNAYSALDDPRASVVLMLFLTRRVGGEVRCGDDASDARFYGLKDLPDNIAFSAHRQALSEIVRGFEAGEL